MYSSAADYAGEKGILDDVIVIGRAEHHAIQSHGSGDHAGRLEKVEQQISGDTTNGNMVLAERLQRIGRADA
ncbi:MAG: hypothetical protein M0Q53_01610 [Prolixibacteraceae bacterium]|nr:hypothetical protein [Prolixibacteraceae bacterium]